MEDIITNIAELERIQSEIEALTIKIKTNDVNMIRANWNDPNGDLFVDNLNDVIKQLDKLYSKIDTTINTVLINAYNEDNTENIM